MSKRYNLYFIFLEDRADHPMPEEKKAAIRKNVETFYKKIKPPWDALPLNNVKGDNPDKKK